MELEEQRVGVADLVEGMHVSRLDRPWEETPFLLQGFTIDSDEQIEMLRQLCEHVYITVARVSSPEPRPVLQKLERRVGEIKIHPEPERIVYKDTVRVEDEVPKARLARANAHELARKIVEDVRGGRELSSEAVSDAVDPIVATVIRSADAFFWLEALGKRDTYHYSHAITCCALAASFGRHMGLPKSELIELGSAGMLMNLGMAALPEDTVDHPGPLTAGQQAEMRHHVELSIRLLEQSGLATQERSEMMAAHHERHDGSGYPLGLSGDQIPLYARMLGIIDTYDALSSDRPHCRAISRHDALQLLYRERDRLFQASLVEQFTQCLGIYPTGSLVELSSGQVAVVLAQNPARRLFPRVTILTHADKTIDEAFPQVDLLMESWTSDPTRRVSIVRALEPGAYGLDAKDLYL